MNDGRQSVDARAWDMELAILERLETFVASLRKCHSGDPQFAELSAAVRDMAQAYQAIHTANRVYP